MKNFVTTVLSMGMGIALIPQNSSAMDDCQSLYMHILIDQKKIITTVHNDPHLTLELSDESVDYEEDDFIIMNWIHREIVGEKRQATTELPDQPTQKRMKVISSEDLVVKHKVKGSRERFVAGEEFSAFKILVDMIRLPNLSDDQKARVMFEMAHQSLLTYNKNDYFKKILELPGVSESKAAKARGLLEKLEAKN